MGWNKGLICLIDALGTKEITTDNSANLYFRSMKIIEDALMKKRNEYENELHEAGYPLIEVVPFSDTFFIIQNCETSNNLDIVHFLLRIVELIARLTASSLRIGLRFRGAISYGEYMLSSPRMIGVAVNDAAKLYEKPQLIGTVLHPNLNTIVSNNIDQLNFPLFNNLIASYNVPLKENDNKVIYSNMYVVNWPYYYNYCCKDDKIDTISSIKEILESFKTVDTKVITKIDNTMTFFQSLYKTYKTIIIKE